MHVDTEAFIYFIQVHPTYIPIVQPVFEMIDRGEITGVSSYVTLFEVLVKPLKDNRPDIAAMYRNVLLQANNLVLFPLDRIITEKGAAISARYNFGHADAVQLATAVHLNVEACVTNDRDWRRFKEIEVFLIDDFLPGGRQRRESARG